MPRETLPPEEEQTDSNNNTEGKTVLAKIDPEGGMVRVDPDKKVSADIALAETIQPPTPEGSGERKSSIREEKLFSSLAETTRKKYTSEDRERLCVENKQLPLWQRFFEILRFFRADILPIGAKNDIYADIKTALLREKHRSGFDVVADTPLGDEKSRQEVFSRMGEVEERYTGYLKEIRNFLSL